MQALAAAKRKKKNSALLDAEVTLRNRKAANLGD